MEEGLPSRAYWEERNSTYSYGLGGRTSRLPPLREYEANATGRLSLELVQSHSVEGRPVKWADRKSWTLEEKLPELLRELEIRAAEERERQRKAKQEAAERERQWNAAMDRARELHAENHRGEVLRDQVARWRTAEEIRAYCDAATASYPDDPSTAEWIAWARCYADELDPLRIAPRMPAAPEWVSAEELRPYLDGWDPYGSHRRRW